MGRQHVRRRTEREQLLFSETRTDNCESFDFMSAPYACESNVLHSIYMIARLPTRSATAFCCRRGLSTSFRPQNVKKASRYYRYAVDVHGQLFLHDTTPKNLTSCFKNPQFLDFFFARVKPNEVESLPNDATDSKTEDEAILSDPEWTDHINGDEKSQEEVQRLALLDRYRWISPCQGEYNFIRCEESPIVFRELEEDGTLRWAGSYTSTFDPSSLHVDPKTGYVYHPSPLSPLRSARRIVEEKGAEYNPYGAYSLLSSALVLQRLASGLDIDPDAFSQGKGGSIEWKGQRWDMGILEKKHRK